MRNHEPQQCQSVLKPQLKRIHTYVHILMDIPHYATCRGVIRGIDFYPTVLSQHCISIECALDRNIMQCVVCKCLCACVSGWVAVWHPSGKF